MAKIAIIVLADTESPGDQSRLLSAMVAAREFRQAGDQVDLIFDGAASKWIGELSGTGHRHHTLYEQIKDTIVGVCASCAEEFGATEAIARAGVPLLRESDGHPSLRRLVVQGYQILPF